jgi:tetratricopeptide (TPR) repeat protein
MRKLVVFSFFVVSFALAGGAAVAQQNLSGLPNVSPRSQVSQIVGVSEISVDYHRPAVKGRKVLGGIVPYGQVWRAGANDNTVIRFADPVRVEGKALAAGAYGLHMIPGEGGWTPREADFEEWLSYGFAELSDEGAELVLRWDRFELPIRIEVDTHELVLAKIRRDLRHLPGFSWQGWSSAAAYCLRENINHEEALGWADRSIQIQETFQNVFTKSRLLAQTGESQQAGALLEKALELGTEAQVNIAGYQLLNAGQVSEALAIFERNTELHPDSWNVWDSLAEGHANAGKSAEARRYYERALSMAPENQRQRIQGAIETLSDAG